MGSDIKNLIGSDPHLDMDSIVFNDYTIRNGGGYTLPADSSLPGQQFIISYWNRDSSIFRVFSKHKNSGSSEDGIVTDILEIKKEDLGKEDIIVEGSCYTPKSDPEIIAIVKQATGNPEFFYKIKKAWRANRKTGKFEKVKAGKIKKCLNESYGI